MDFYEVLDRVVALLRTRGRVTYRALKLQFQLDDEHLETLKEELIEAQRVAADEDGKVLVWVGDASVVSSQSPVASSSQPPTPQTSDSGLRTPDAKPQTLDPRLTAGERRQLTLMFCDLVGSTALSALLDPEELREVVHAYHQTCAGVISRYAGHTAQHLGDGLLVYFGYPAAHEDDAQRAVRAGLGIIEALQQRNSQTQPTVGARLRPGFSTGHVPLQVRIGIHTGLVVVGEIGSSAKCEMLALGETPNIAARVQGIAEPDTVVMSTGTHRLVQGLFECQALGPQTLKGISTPLAVYRVIAESAAQSRFEVAVGTGLTPLVGREEELGILQRRWTQAKEGAGQVVLLNGEPGIGKSRLVQVLKEQASARILLLVNYRPEYRQEWGSKTYYTHLRLSPLGGAEAEELLTVLLGHDPSLTAVQQLILAKTEGTPFFMEEVVQTLAEEGVLSGERGQYRLEHAPSALHISPTVQGVLAARIDRLAAEEKALLQQLAVIGRQFPLSLVRQVVAQPEEALYHLLASLQRKEFLYEQPAFPEVEYFFKHALTQEVAYGTVLHEWRKALHERTAQAIAALYRATLDEHYSELAHHYSRSGNTAKAVEYLHLAGQQAVQRSANAEAITHLTTALELLTTLPDTRARAQQELMLQVTLGVPLQVTRSFASPEVRAVYIRARELCQQVGETRQLFPVLMGLRAFHFVRGEPLAARELGEQLLGLAQREQDPALLVEAYWALGIALFPLGEFSAAQAYLEQSLTLYDTQRHHSHVFLYGIEPGIFGLSYAALVLWYLGYPDQALQKSKAARTLAQELSHPFSLAGARIFAALSHQLRRDRPLTQEWAEAGITLAREHGFPLWLGQGAVLQGWALAEQGQSEEGITQIRHGLAAHQALGAGILHSYFLALLAEAYGKAGQAEEGLAALAEALAVVDKSGERVYEAELYRLKGELTLQSQVQGLQSKVEEEAEACFRKAIEIARHQQAKSLELRAVMSLSRLWQQQGKKREAHELLAEIYNWFTEGFDTKDLQEAKALLDALSQES